MSSFDRLVDVRGSCLALLVTATGCLGADEPSSEVAALAQGSASLPESSCRAERLLKVPLASLRERLAPEFVESSPSPRVFPTPDGGYRFHFESWATPGRGALVAVSASGETLGTMQYIEPERPSHDRRYGVGLASKSGVGDQVVTLWPALEPTAGVEAQAFGPGPAQGPVAVPGMETFWLGGRTGSVMTGTSLDARRTVFAFGNIGRDFFIGAIGADGVPVGATHSLPPRGVLFCPAVVPTAGAALVSFADSDGRSADRWTVIELDAVGALRFQASHPAPSRRCRLTSTGGDIVTAAWQDHEAGSPVQITRLDRRHPSDPPSLREVSMVDGTGVVKGLVPSGPHTLMISRPDTRDSPERPAPIVITRELDSGAKEVVRFEDDADFEPMMIATDDQSLRFYARRPDAIDIYAVSCPDAQAPR